MDVTLDLRRFEEVRVMLCLLALNHGKGATITEVAAKLKGTCTTLGSTHEVLVMIAGTLAFLEKVKDVDWASPTSGEFLWVVTDKGRNEVSTMCNKLIQFGTDALKVLL